ncbi:hypothetical protein [Adlercreutzia sp. ZJ242]|uniref:hypothetical protein n=1 Tax=Adlercreutzia sp. ZJ242 TaxID=2709409 RepID=UPI0013ECED09|nr:hypothetical protein [Adlercreutzia sp. ZJ242]
MSPASAHRKALYFDLDTQCLRDKFGEAGRSTAYSTIRAALKDLGFEHRQGSGYQSTSALSDLDAFKVVMTLYDNLDWLPDCVQKLDTTNIGMFYETHTVVCEARSRRLQRHRI